jgi:hypothetical protein
LACPYDVTRRVSLQRLKAKSLTTNRFT